MMINIKHKNSAHMKLHNKSFRILNLKTFSQSGVGLVELMVALVIGLVVSLAIYGVLTASEGNKRSTNSINDIDQVGAYTLYQLDKVIRSAGSGFSAGSTPLPPNGILQAATYAYGCPLRVARSGAQVLPSAGYAAPFAAVPAAIRLAPVIIMDGAAPGGDDVILAMTGSAGLGESGTKLTATGAAASIDLTNHAGFRASDIVLLTAPAVAGVISPCLVEQVSSAFVPTAGAATVPLAGEFYQANVAGTGVNNYADTAIALNIGQVPAFNMFAVGTNNGVADVLFRYDLLSPPAALTASVPNPAPYADSVYRMHAIYGINTSANPLLPTLAWVAPTGAYSSANLLAGTAAANTALSTIRAIKVGLVMRSALPERANVSQATATLFASTSVPVTVNLAPLNFRYRAFEATIPLRNVIMLSQPIIAPPAP